MRRSAVALIVGLAIVVIIGGLMIQSLLIMQRIAAVSETEGTIEISPPGRDGFIALSDTPRVVAGTIVRTGNDGRVTLNWVDGSRIRLDPNTRMKVLKCQFNQGTDAETYLFRLNVGKIWVRVLKRLSLRSKFEVRTPAATAAVRGTVFSVSVRQKGQTEVSVLEGQVNLKSDEKRLVVREDQFAQVGSRAFGTVLEQDSNERREWENGIEVARPSLKLSKPESDNVAAGTKTITVSGDAERSAKVTVNGNKVDTNDLTGKFETEIRMPRDRDSFKVTVKAVDRRGFSRVITKTLHR